MPAYPALDVSWPARPADDRIDLLLAALDAAAPTAVEDTPDGIRVFFVAADARAAAAAIVSASAPEARCVQLDVPDENWAARSQAALTRVQVGRLVVCPPWDVPAASEAPGCVRILIQPAMGFGTGHHASTRLCLGLLQDLPVEGARVLDVGTGSGVLALAAWRLGAATVTAIDHDEDALVSARESAALNQAGDAVTFESRELAAPWADSAADLVLANLTGALLVREAASLAGRCDPAGAMVLSGILADEADSVAEAFANVGWTVAERRDEDEWVGLRLVRTAR